MVLGLHGHPTRTVFSLVFVYYYFYAVYMLFAKYIVNTSFALSQAYVWRFDPVHPKTFVLGVLVGK